MTTLSLLAPRINHWLLLLLAFCLPISSSAMTIFALLLLICWLAEGNYREKTLEILNNPICIALFVFLAVMMGGILWSDSISSGLDVVKHRWKILVLPFFLTSIRVEKRWTYLYAFIGGVLLATVLVDLAYFGVLRQLGLTSPPFYSHKIINHLILTPMTALSIYLLFHQFLWGRDVGWRKWGGAALGVLMTMNIFLMQGRAGQIAFIFLMATLLFQYYRNNIKRALLVTGTVLPLVCLGAYHLSPIFQHRVQQVQENIVTFKTNKETSVGLRLHYWLTSWRIIRQSPWLGVGTGDFAVEYEKINQHYSPTISTTDNPHNQYLLVTAQLGLLGLVTFLALFVTHFFEAFRRNDEWQRIRFAVPLFFMIIMFSESYLDIAGTGFLFSLLSALLFKQSRVETAMVSA
ncbi:O-antigen ligase family protein [Desulfobulbus propionicus]